MGERSNCDETFAYLLATNCYTLKAERYRFLVSGQ